MTVAASATPTRRKLRFGTNAEVMDEVRRLQKTPHRRLGSWSLPQICFHLAMTIERNSNPPATDMPTPEQTAKKDAFFGMVFSPDGFPPGMPLPKELLPSSSCTDAELDRYDAALKSLETYPHRCVAVGGCGPVPIDEVRALHRAHAAHHLSFLQPVHRREGLRYENIDAIIADVEHLRRGYVKTGNWSLEQAAHHLAYLLNYYMSPGPHAPVEASPQMRETFQNMLASGKIPSGLKAPDRVLPPEKGDPAAVDQLIDALNRLKDYPGPFAPHRLFGQLSNDEFRRHSLIHAAHHLSFLVPVES